MSRITTAALDARITALEALITELKQQREVKPVLHHNARVASTANLAWEAKKAAAIAEAKRTGKSVVMNCSH